MRKIIFTAVATTMLLIGSTVALADGSSYPQPTKAGNSGSSTSSSGQHTATTAPSNQTYQARVDIQNHAFSPANLTVWQGTSVIWTNQDNTAHTVTSSNTTSGQEFDSGPIQPGEHFGWLFGSVGTFPYHCSIHPDMTGTITVVVKPSTSPPTTPSAPTTPNPPAPSAPSTGAQANATATANNYNTYNQPAEQEPTTTSASPAATVLPGTGPAGIITIAGAATVLSSCVYYLFTRKRIISSRTATI